MKTRSQPHPQEMGNNTVWDVRCMKSALRKPGKEGRNRNRACRNYTCKAEQGLTEEEDRRGHHSRQKQNTGVNGVNVRQGKPLRQREEPPGGIRTAAAGPAHLSPETWSTAQVSINCSEAAAGAGLRLRHLRSHRRAEHGVYQAAASWEQRGAGGYKSHVPNHSIWR